MGMRIIEIDILIIVIGRLFVMGVYMFIRSFTANKYAYFRPGSWTTILLGDCEALAMVLEKCSNQLFDYNVVYNV